MNPKWKNPETIEEERADYELRVKKALKDFHSGKSRTPNKQARTKDEFSIDLLEAFIPFTQ
jgi:hypothetical protein